MYDFAKLIFPVTRVLINGVTYGADEMLSTMPSMVMALLLAMSFPTYAMELAGIVNDAEQGLTPPLAAQFLPATPVNKTSARSILSVLLGRAQTCDAGYGYCAG